MRYSQETAMKKYEQMLQKESPFFTTQGYTILHFAHDIGTNRTYASRFANEVLGCKFTDLLNNLRMEYFMQQQAQHPETSLYKLAAQAGYSNSFSFRRVFFKMYKTTPSQYFKEHEAN